MTTTNNTPSIRFAGFTDAWERRKLGECCSEFKSGDFIPAIEITPIGEFPIYGGNGLRGYSSRYNYNGDYALIGRQGALCGNMNYSTGKAYFTEHAVAVKANSSNNTRFLFYLMGTMNLGQYSAQSAQPGLAVNKLTILLSFFPNIVEQEKIAGFLTTLDYLITLHQRKYEKLVNIKKSMLDKMFPKNGELVPEVRFSGFTDAWERRKLGELGSVAMNKRIFKEQTTESGDVPFYKIGTFGGSADAYISNELYNEYTLKYPHPSKGDILISASGSIGRTVIYSGNREYFQDSNIVWLQHDDRIQNTFLRYFYEIVKWEGLEGSTIKRLYNKNILETEICLPCINEQRKIGDYFIQLNHLITLHQRKLEKLQNIKIACLEKMFV